MRSLVIDGCFQKVGVLFVGVLIIRALLFGGPYGGTPDS